MRYVISTTFLIMPLLLIAMESEKPKPIDLINPMLTIFYKEELDALCNTKQRFQKKAIDTGITKSVVVDPISIFDSGDQMINSLEAWNARIKITLVEL